MGLKIYVPKESRSGENRVALTPSVVKQLIAEGFECYIEPDAGSGAGFSDEAYQGAGALIAGQSAAWAAADVVLKVNPPSPDEVAQMKKGAVLISMMYAFSNPALVEACSRQGVTSFALDAVPRISRAQKMDVLSSQANLAGYKAVIIGANEMGKIFPLLMTAAGTITPSKVLIFGAGVAGLQAVATAKRLGAVVEVTDVRPETKEQVESLGGKFLVVDSAEGIKTEGGYAREVSEDFLRKQKELVEKHIAQADLVITTAQVFGRKAPVLITEDMVRLMKPGSVIVDMAVEQGGNCSLSEAGKTVVNHGVKIVGQTNLPSLLPVNASELFAKNISTLLLHLGNGEGFKLDREEEITKGCLITHDGQLVHESTKQLLNNAAQSA
ncbi:NAD(P) transhydrogenase subunit alpha [Anseongella ginsenosidimutans]|uniref:NAD(P) transhydrogenase subunit alpha part 1 n=1 Tax=Anseongella ginsenosidimutans TaxID=496056 RepID=A0A4R3KY69_9SPHI|nr:Re/Si-specific NAD(P)(+) transhydrogenase subunit alpha [Anseongella ginsenosidimutans]QEC51339.1 Re/Si-specific NAD(P)(+) transhydrogenase subunit alpha [Anseongella ginsenosidimutans]TCS89966.1 NAD(P) transhydrogenase subunit alpha [Anseongella ginsenosidimutans]